MSATSITSFEASQISNAIRRLEWLQDHLRRFDELEEADDGWEIPGYLSSRECAQWCPSKAAIAQIREILRVELIAEIEKTSGECRGLGIDL